MLSVLKIIDNVLPKRIRDRNTATESARRQAFRDRSALDNFRHRFRRANIRSNSVRVHSTHASTIDPRNQTAWALRSLIV